MSSFVNGIKKIVLAPFYAIQAAFAGLFKSFRPEGRIQSSQQKDF